MLKILIKKQIFESWRGIFINSKTGKARSKKSRIAMFIFFATCFVFIAFSFFGMSMMLTPLFKTEYEWLVYAIFGLLAISISTFLNAFSASSVLYKAKDNEMLLSMPIEPKEILLSRIVSLYIMATLYASCVWLPVCLNGWIHGANSIVSIVFEILLVFVIGLLSTALSCIIGYVFALINNASKNRALVTVLSSVLLLGVYYVTMFRLESIFATFVQKSSEVANSISSWGMIFVVLAKAAQGDLINFVLFTLISIVVFVLVYYVLSKTFISISTRGNNVVKTNGKIKYATKSDSKSALFKKELKRFTSSPAYMLNTALGVVFVLALAVMAVLKSNDINEILVPLSKELPIINDFLPLVILVSIMMVISINCISTPSISLEGNKFWILKSLPINPMDVFDAKERLHVLINGIPSLISIIVLGLCFKINTNILILISFILILFIIQQALIGLIFGVLRPNFTWTNETQPIKQSLNMLFVMLIGWLIIIAIGGGYYLLRNKIQISLYCEILVVVMYVITYLLRKWLMTKGVKVYNNL